MKVKVTIMLKKGVLDPQGKAIENTLGHLGYDQVQDVRQGRLITMDVDEDTSYETIQQMCDKLLANPVIEDYEIQMPN